MYTLTQREGGGVRVCVFACACVYMLEWACVLVCVFMLECVCAKCLTYIFKFDAFWGLLTPV